MMTPYDPFREFHSRVLELRNRRESFAVATVVAVRGSASAKPGSKAILSSEGRNLWGWVGGGCAESYVGEQAVEAIKEGRPRIVQADLDDEIFGLGMPCGGVMDIYIEPELPIETLKIPDWKEARGALTHLASNLGFAVEFETGSSSARKPEPASILLELGRSLARHRGGKFKSLRSTRGILKESEKTHAEKTELPSEILIMGNSRITEELAQWSSLLPWKVRVHGPGLAEQASAYPQSVTLHSSEADFADLRVNSRSALVVASHHKGDDQFLQAGLRAGAEYLALVASPKRSGLVFEHLRKNGVPENRLRLIHAPAGLDFGGCRNPSEIALSIVCEILWLSL